MTLARAAAIALLTAIALGSATPARAAIRTYFIAADDVTWDYAPSGRDLINGTALPAVQSPQLGWRYHKALYREYTDATFRHLKPRSSQTAYLGLLGPVIRGEVGDTIVVVFKNNTHLHLSIHAHGVQYDKASEGAPYSDGSPHSARLDDAVPPGGSYTYTWQVPERSGPGPMDPSSIVWLYYSHTDDARDVNTGPIGPIIITRRGMARPDGSPRDVDAEFITMFSEMDESQSRMISENLADVSINPRHVSASADSFQAGNQFFTINGFMFGNMPLLTMTKGQRVRWYVFASMSDFDFHAPTWHGQTVLYDGQRSNTLALGPSDTKVADMVPLNPGVWLFDCDLDFHYDSGMTARFKVLP